MKLKDEYVKLPKEMLYETYLKIVYEPKNYDNITRKKMIEEIIKEYNQEKFLYYMCTEKELDFLKYISSKKIEINDLEKYELEIKNLNEKCIFSRVTFEVFEEQAKNVKDALKYYEKKKKEIDDVVIFMISRVKMYGIIPTRALVSTVESLFHLNEKEINNIMGNPLFHFYCEFSYDYINFTGREEELVSYRDYYDILDELAEARKVYGMAGSISCDIRDDYDSFYYGFPIKNKKVKKMVDEVNKRLDKEVLFRIIDESRVLNSRIGLNLLIDDKLLKIVNEALDELPCAAMNGFTPKEYEKQKNEEINLDREFSHIPQNNAHLCKDAADHYYKLYLSLLDYVNKKYKIEPDLKKIHKQEGLNVYLLSNVDKYLWKHKEVIDDYIKDNDYNFTEEELLEIKEFKNAITSDHFIIVGFEREYTKFLSDDGKLYMVKGIRSNFDEIIDASEIPKVISTTLLMFKGYIVFNSFFGHIDIKFGNDVKKEIINQTHSAITYYHL